MKDREVLIRLAIYYNFDFTKMYSEVSKKTLKGKYLKDRLTTAKLRNMKIKGVKFITLLDPEYPKEFTNVVTRPPMVLCYTGNISLLEKAIKDKEYSYLLGPNKFELDESKLITSKFNIITFGNNELNLWTDESVDILRIIPLFVKNIICTKKLKKTDTFGLIVASALYHNLESSKNVYVTPTILPSENNQFIKEGCNLLDSRKELV